MISNIGIISGLVILATLVAGCGKSYPNVSGTVTLNGKPVANVNVLFVPVSTKEQPFPGPYAEAVTDSTGKYSLVTRSGKPGATPGLNIVEFYSAGLSGRDFLKESESIMAMADSSTHSKIERSQSAKSKSMGKGDPLSPDARTEFTVPEQGTNTADFELSNLKPPPS